MENNKELTTIQFDRKIAVKLLLLLVFSFASCFAAGYGFGYIHVMRDVAIGTAGTCVFLLTCAFISPRWTSRIFLFFAITMTLYFSTGFLHGAPTFKIIGSLLETDFREAGEFLTSIPIKVYLMQITFLLGSLWAWQQTKSLFHAAPSWRRKVKQYVIIVLIVLLITPFAGTFLSGGSLQDDESAIPIPIVGFYVDAIAAPMIYLTRKQELVEQSKKPASWHIQSVNNKYKNYVVVIGESARSDYMNVYGFPLQDTPFFSKTNGLFIDGYISTAELTMASVPATLSFHNEANNSIVSLARKAGFATSWLSNQGMLGFFSSGITLFALQGEYNYYTQRGDYQKSLSTSDIRLLPEFKKILAKPESRPRLIVLHLMGSHANFCDRLDNPVAFKLSSPSLSCYVSTIKETDKLLEDMVDILKEKGESYSLIYFSDHGLKHVGNGAEQSLTHGGDTYQSFAVPFAKLSSDDTEHKVIKVQRSAFNFLKGFSQWTGIKAAELPTDGYDFFGTQPDKPDGTNLDRVNKLPQDPITVRVQ